MSMTRQEQLDAVVRNYGVWEDRFEWAFLLHGRVKFTNNKDATSLPSFTRAEVEQRKAELQNKPSWDDVRFSDAEYMAQDANGQWVLYSGKPVANESHGLFVHGNANKDVSVTTGKGEVIGGWRDTLEKRPVADDQPTPEEEEAFNMLEARNGECIGGYLAYEAGKWDGEGLPPDGVECEYKHPDFGWTGCSTIGVFQGKMVVAPNGGGFYQATKEELRPIKSDREKWIEAVKEKSNTGIRFTEDVIDLLESIFDEGLACLPKVSGKLKLPEVD